MQNHTTILITGVAGFIGSHLARELLEKKHNICIVGIDNLNSYYDINLKKSRLNKLIDYKNFEFVEESISHKQVIINIFEKYSPDIVINLAAQAGVRYSITNPDVYIESNIIGFFNILEACRYSMSNVNSSIKHLIYASSSSVYGENTKTPYSVDDKVDSPVSLYAATKKSNELMAFSYSKLYGIPTTGLRFFTVYGPEGRPDMAYYSFTDKIINGESIQLFNHGNMYRDFTFIDDIVAGILKIIHKSPTYLSEEVPYRIYNIGNNKPCSLKDFVDTLENCLLKEKLIQKPSIKEYLPMQPGDVYQTYADINSLKIDYDFSPDTPLEKGLTEFVKWYKTYYKL